MREGAIDLGDITGTGGLSNGVVRVARSTINGVDDGVDYFRFTLTGYTFIDLSLRRQDYDADMFIENADGIVLEPFNSTSDGTATEMILVTLPAGHYFIRVEAQEPGLNAYTLRYKVFEGVRRRSIEIDGLERAQIVGRPVPARQLDDPYNILIESKRKVTICTSSVRH